MVSESDDVKLLQAVTVESGAGFQAAHARVVERSNAILRTTGRRQKTDALPRVQQAILRVARAYGSDQRVACQIALEELRAIAPVAGSR